MKDSAKKVTTWGIVLNIFLFIIKFVVGILSNSIAILSDAFNSLSDILAAIGIFFAVKIGKKPADATHPFGHHRAEPIAAFIVALFTAMISIQIIKTAIQRIITPEVSRIGGLAIGVLLITIIVKAGMRVYFKKWSKTHRSPGVEALAVDAQNDVVISSIALFGVLGTYFEIMYVESIIAIILGIWLIKVAYDLGIENIDYLMGKAPSEALEKKIVESAKNVKGVHDIEKITAHYVGNYVHVEIHVRVLKNVSLQKAHDIGNKVKKSVEAMEDIDRCFVHIDPI